MNTASAAKHILFVDDDLTSRVFVEALLRAGLPGVRVSCAVNGALALTVLDSEPVDLLITDLQMPVMDGIELLLQVARRRLLLPVLVVTAHGSPVTETLALAGGAIECIEKPLMEAAFLGCVRELLLGGAQRSRLEVVSIAGIVRLIGAERRTCALRVTSAQAQGVLLFAAGELVDARQGELSGLSAARAILAWDDCAMTLDTRTRARARTMHISVAELLGAPRRAEWVPAASEASLSRAMQSRGATGQAPKRAPVVMPAPMTAPSSTRPNTPARGIRPAPRLAAPTRSPPLASHGLAPPPVPAPPRVTAPPRAPEVQATRETSVAPVRSAPVVAESPAVESVPAVAESPAVESAPVVAESPAVESAPVVAESAVVESAPVIDESPAVEAAPAPAESAVVEAAPVIDESPVEAVSTMAESAAAKPLPDYSESDTYYDLVDRARDLLRNLDYEGAERLLLRALEIQPGDRVAEQNLRVLARRRGAVSGQQSHSSSP